MGEGELERDGAEGDIEALAELGERLDLLRSPRLAFVNPCEVHSTVSQAKPEVEGSSLLSASFTQQDVRGGAARVGKGNRGHGSQASMGLPGMGGASRPEEKGVPMMARMSRDSMTGNWTSRAC